MAKAEKPEGKSFREWSAELEHQGRDVAHKIWLAGIGAYGRAFVEARENIEKLNHSTNELFEDLVKRGEEIEDEVRERITQNEAISTANDRVSKVVESATKIQERQRERFEDRMDRMRSVLGFKSDSQLDELSAKIDALVAEVAELKGQPKPKPATRKAKAAPSEESVAERVARLTDAVAPAAKAPAKKAPARKAPAKKAAPKAKASATTAKAPAKKAPAKKAAPSKPRDIS